MTTASNQTPRHPSAHGFHDHPLVASAPLVAASRRAGKAGWGLLVCLVVGLLVGGGAVGAVFILKVIPNSIVPAIIAKMTEAAQQPTPPTLVSVDEVKQQTLADQRLVTGMIQPVRQSTIASEESGRVLLAPPDMGTTVRKDDVLAKLDTSLLEKQLDISRAAMAEAQAMLAEQQATLDQANNLRKRYEDLAKSGGVSQTELDQAVRDQQVATAKITTAQATIAARQADLAQITERLGKMIVRAPFDGTLTQKLTEVGQWLSPGSSVAQIADWAVVDARIDIPESIIDAIGLAGLTTGEQAQGPAVTLNVPSLNKDVTGKLFRVVPSSDAAARTYPALVRIDNADGLLRPGMTVTANLATAENIDALTVARDAVQITPTGPRVIVNRSGAAAVVPVIILFSTADRFVVHGELKPGELVVTEGNERLVAGAPLKIVGAFADHNPPEPPEAANTPESPDKSDDSSK